MQKRKHRKLYGNKLGVSYNVFIVSTIEYNGAFFAYNKRWQEKKRSLLDSESIMLEKALTTSAVKFI